METDTSGRSVVRLGRVACSLAAALACLLLTPTMQAAPLPQRPNIIFILMDDLRWDEMDYPFVRVPNIQRIARDGVRFSNAFATTPLCSPSRASILTGQYVGATGDRLTTKSSRRARRPVQPCR